MINCVTSTLAPFTPTSNEWTAAHVAHLYRSFGYGADFATILAGLQMTPQELVDSLLDQAVNMTQPDPYYWSEWDADDYINANDDNLLFQHYYQIKQDWFRRGVSHSFQQKMSIFWHDHFATQWEVYNCNRYGWRYYKLLHEMSFGNFRSFVEQMGLTEAMLVFLNGNTNVVDEPNENYARELMELFTMGENNGYTQTDIEEVAKALTGYRVQMYECTEQYFDSDYYDSGVKTIFGQTGNFNYDDVHELIFTLRRQEVAEYICTKLYQYFIFKEVDETIIAGLAQTFIDENWEIVPVLRQLFSSEHFFDDHFRGAIIKSPVDLLLQTVVTLGLDPTTDMEEGIFEFMNFSCVEMGQDLFEPPNVAGWPGHRFWLSENALAYRWSFSQSMLNNYVNEAGREKFLQLALAASSSISDPYIIASSVIDHLLDVNIPDELLEVAVQHLKAGVPENYFDDGTWNLYWSEAPFQLGNMIRYIFQIPEYQLT